VGLRDLLVLPYFASPRKFGSSYLVTPIDATEKESERGGKKNPSVLSNKWVITFAHDMVDCPYIATARGPIKKP
jgi:hypothetical protein